MSTICILVLADGDECDQCIEGVELVSTNSKHDPEFTTHLHISGAA